MKQTTQPLFTMPNESDANQFADNMGQAAAIWQRIVQRIIMGALNDPTQSTLGHADTKHIQDMFLECTRKLLENPESLQPMQLGLWKDHMQLWHETTERLLGHNVAANTAADRRFRDEAWQNNPYFDFLYRSYLINTHWIQQSVDHIEGLDKHTAKKASFFTRQLLDALSPSNFLFTNPQAIRETLERKGENLVHGLTNMLADIEKGQGTLRISMADDKNFEVGKNIAATQGDVIFENDLMQLIHYKPLCDKAHKTPLLFVPAWINKYYILDLSEDNSFIRFALSQGYNVFVISWANPNAELGRKSFEDYLSEGPLTALDVIAEITGEKKCNLVGYCLGGTLVASMLAYLHAHNEQDRIGSVTYLTTLVDFTEVGELSVFIDDEQLDSIEERMSERGYLDAKDMAMTFNMLRANDLIWSFYVNNYLLGKDPFPFDILYWNADSTRMPATMHSFYLRNMYQRNKLIEPGGITLLGTPIDLSIIKTPTYILSTKEDHIAPWQSTYAATGIYGGKITFTLAESGHVAGVINPPSKKKYGYWSHKKLKANAQQWLDQADYVKASWWTHWQDWQEKYAGAKVATKKTTGNKRYQPLEAAPGSYAASKG